MPLSKFDDNRTGFYTGLFLIALGSGRRSRSSLRSPLGGMRGGIRCRITIELRGNEGRLPTISDEWFRAKSLRLR